MRPPRASTRTSTTRQRTRSVPRAPTPIRACIIPGRCSFPTRPSCWWAEIRHVAPTSSTSRSTLPRISSTPTARRPLRPTIYGVTPGAFAYGQVFQVDTPDAANIASVVLVRPGSQTHAFDMDQRLVGMSFTVSTGRLNVTAPPHGNIAPPGYYMLFVLNAAGVPSVARFVHSRHRPHGDHHSPDQRHDAPGSVFSGSGTIGNDQRLCLDFPGGRPASSARPGASLLRRHSRLAQVTDNGAHERQPATART